jgi:alpha-glucuronidase
MQGSALFAVASLSPVRSLAAFFEWGTGAYLVPRGSAAARGEDGYRMWLRYEAQESGRIMAYRRTIQRLVVQGDSAGLKAAGEELRDGLSGVLGRPIAIGLEAGPGSVIVGDAHSALIRDRIPSAALRRLGPEGYVLKTVPVAGGTAIVIAAQTGRGTVYGAFHLLRLLQMQMPVSSLNIEEKPASPLRLIDHWDNVDRDRDTNGNLIGSSSGEGVKQSPDRWLRNESIWKWDQLPDQLSPRYHDYARILASVGINGIVVNNPNTSKHGLTDWKLLTAPYIGKLAALAGAFRPYGIRLYISAPFDSPMLIDHLQTADPLDAEVRRWWARKADEIYASIPDFGGFLIKADSEQEPGPMVYHRTHAQGANMLASALKPHGGIVMWRAFVYGSTMKDFPPEVRADRARQAYDFFHPLDGQFAENVVLQVKHGPIDFGLREPVSPLFGGMPHTNLMMEGFDYWAPAGVDAAICYLAPMWKKILDFDTYSKGPNSTVKRIISGDLNGNPLGGSAAVITVGDVPNWTGQQLHQANIYAYGRLSWGPNASVAQITDEWARMTFGNDATVVRTVSRLLLESWGIVADYKAPLGLGGPLNGKGTVPPDRATWSGDWPSPETRPKLHGSDAKGTGIDRTSKGTGFILQYAPRAGAQFESPATCPTNQLLFFHHLPYTYRLASGETVIQDLYDALFSSVDRLENLRQSWIDLGDRIDAERYRDVLWHLQMHLDDAKVWRDVMTKYFFSLSGIPDRDGRTGPELGNKK